MSLVVRYITPLMLVSGALTTTINVEAVEVAKGPTSVTGGRGSS